MRYLLKLADGDDAGEVDADELQPGDVLDVEGATWRVRAVVPVERVGEFVDGATFGVAEVEPVG